MAGTNVIRNNKAYDSVDVSPFINGIPTSLTDLSYNTSQEHQLNHTLSADGSSWSVGKKSHTCTAGFMMHDITPIELAAGGDLLKVKPFYLNVLISNEYNIPVLDTILVKFQDQGREITGDMGLQKQYELFVLTSKYNVPQ
jgi:hypothetical protein